MKLTEKSNAVFEYVKANGGKVTIDEIAQALDKTTKSINANVNDLVKKELVIREKVAGETPEDKEITYVVITEAGNAFVPSAE